MDQYTTKNNLIFGDIKIIFEYLQYLFNNQENHYQPLYSNKL